MAIYHLSVSNVSRAAGSSSVAACSYITARPMRDDFWGRSYDGFGRRERVLLTRTMLPAGAPADWADPEKLFNAIEAAEAAGDARTAKRIVVALPVELDARGRQLAVEALVRRELTARGYAATWAIHEDGDGRNPHAHILVPNRPIDAKTGRFARHKQRSEYVRDEHGERVPLIDPATGVQKTDKRGRRQWRRRSVRLNPLDGRDTLKAMRADWADIVNAMLPDGVERIDHRSHEARGLEDEPTIHEGPAAREIERRGGTSERCQANRDIRARNGIRARIRDLIRRQLPALDRIIHQLETQLEALKTALRRPQEPDGHREPELPRKTVSGPGRGQNGAHPAATPPPAPPEPEAPPEEPEAWWAPWLDDARRQLEAGREARARDLEGRASSARTAAQAARSPIGAGVTDQWSRDVWPHLAAVRDALREASGARLGHRRAARRALEAAAAEHSALLARDAPWLASTTIPTDPDGLGRYIQDTRAASCEHRAATLDAQADRLQAQAAAVRGEPITDAAATLAARALARRYGPGPDGGDGATPWSAIAPTGSGRDIAAAMRATERAIRDHRDQPGPEPETPAPVLPDDPTATWTPRRHAR